MSESERMKTLESAANRTKFYEENTGAINSLVYTIHQKDTLIEQQQAHIEELKNKQHRIKQKTINRSYQFPSAICFVNTVGFSTIHFPWQRIISLPFFFGHPMLITRLHESFTSLSFLFGRSSNIIYFRSNFT